MNVSYLIMAHNQPTHLYRLIYALNTPSAHFYVHIDQKSDISDFLRYSYPENVFFVENRIAVHHAGFSLLKVMALLLESAYRNEKSQYFQFLSGWDYPIKNNQFILGYLQEHYPMNFINFYPLVDDADFISNIKKYHFIDGIQSMPAIFHKPLKALQMVVKHLPVSRDFFPDMVPYRGSCWCCLNRETVGYILNFLNTKKGQDFLEYFKYSECPDEIFFQTVVMNSPHAASCRFYQRDIAECQIVMKNENKAYLHYIDWNPSRENPALLDLNDYEALKNSSALYARKYQEGKSDALLEALDQLIGVYGFAQREVN